ncbi:right-handed parallel beta-helix repeat-containing protein [Peribacillus frigoritolerans]|uniref:right-handed parallel beta-helix repeat-containing protein n=1 Tax=Peribacillus frigoritolerans TaxID=450367 RepID=UPI003CFC7400
MKRRNLLKKILLFIFALFLGNTVKKEDENMILRQIDSSLVKGKDGKDEIRVLTEKTVDLAEDVEARGVNIKHFGVAGDGVVDDTSKIQEAINYCVINKKELLLENKTYLIKGSGITVPSDNLTIRGNKIGNTTIKVLDMDADSSIFTLSSVRNIKFENIIFDGNKDPNVKHAINCSGNNVDKNLNISYCKFVNFIRSNNRTIYVWQARDIWIKSNKFVDCVRPIFLDSPNDNVYVESNIIISPSSIMVNGIQCNSASGGIRSVYIAGNTIDGAKVDVEGNGRDGHAIRIFQSRGVKILGNTTKNCAISGILIGIASFDSVANGNISFGNKSGIYVELDGNDTTIGEGAQRGAIVSNNTIFNNDQGIAISYSAASIVQSNIVHDNQGRGIVCDSDKVNIINNIVYNNYKDTNKPNAAQFYTKAGIEVYGKESIISNNICFDNQSIKTQLHGIAVNNDSHIVTGNMLKDNAKGGLHQISGGTNNSIANNIE